VPTPKKIAKNRLFAVNFDTKRLKFTGNTVKCMSNVPPNEAPVSVSTDETKPRTQWHPAAVLAFRTELEDYRDDLAIEAECQLTTEPLRIDVVIIKKTRDVVIQKNIARIFRQYNIVEYKSPDDHVSIEDYHKTHAYARLYAALNKVGIDDLSVTVATTRHPKKLLAFLEKRFKVRQEQQGIFVVDGEVYPTQIIVVSELSEKDNFWLVNLRNDLTIEQWDKVITAAEDKPDIGPYIYALANANAKTLEEFVMQNVLLTEKLDAYFTKRCAAPWKAEGKAEGKAETLLKILRKRFNKVPKDVESTICKMNDPVALDSWAEHALDCQSMTEFAEAIR